MHLLDTHALLWWLADSPRLSETARKAISKPEAVVSVSAASAWEIAIKVRKGKLTQTGAIELLVAFGQTVVSRGFQLIAINHEDAVVAGGLTIAHQDPFDRMLIAQALSRRFQLISIDPVADEAGCPRLW